MSRNKHYTVSIKFDIAVMVPNDLSGEIASVLAATKRDQRLLTPYENLFKALMADQAIWEKFLIHKAVLNAQPYIDADHDTMQTAINDIEGERQSASPERLAKLIRLDPADEDAILSASSGDWTLAFDVVNRVIATFQEPLRATIKKLED